MIQSIIRYILTALSAFLVGHGALASGQDLGGLTIEQVLTLAVTLGVTIGWSKLQKLWQKNNPK